VYACVPVYIHAYAHTYLRVFLSVYFLFILLMWPLSPNSIVKHAKSLLSVHACVRYEKDLTYIQYVHVTYIYVIQERLTSSPERLTGRKADYFRAQWPPEKRFDGRL
jgi:hypothetical protein